MMTSEIISSAFVYVVVVVVVVEFYFFTPRERSARAGRIQNDKSFDFQKDFSFNSSVRMITFGLDKNPFSSLSKKDFEKLKGGVFFTGRIFMGDLIPATTPHRDKDFAVCN